jgi:hypothetical protein
MATFLERYQTGDHVAVWNDLMALGNGVRREPYYADALAVAAETMRRARHNVELIIQRLDAKGYRFRDTVSSAEEKLSRLDMMDQMSTQFESIAKRTPTSYNIHSMKMLETMQAMKAKMAPFFEKAAANTAKEAAASRKPPLEDPYVFSPPDAETSRLLERLEKAAGGPVPLSLRAWYEQVGGVSLMGSDPVLNAVDFSNRNVLQQFQSLAAQRAMPIPTAGDECAPDPLVIYPLDALMDDLLDEDSEESRDGEELQLVISPDDLHKANISGDAYYITLPDAGADFKFDDWHNNTFVNYLRKVFQWGGFPGWERSKNPPHKEIAELTAGLLPL